MARATRIHDILTQQIKPLELQLIDESAKHHVPTGGETHFKLTLVADYFLPYSRVERHRLIYALLQDEFQTGLHALSLHLYTPVEWMKRASPSPDSPSCKGGHAHDERVT